ncbi:surface protein 1, partial [Lasiosphaeria miniovina]
AAPAPADVVESVQANEQLWTVERMLRVCDGADTTCNWSFVVNKNVGWIAPTPCEFTVRSVNGQKASRSPSEGWECGPFRVSTGWNGQFGELNGFTTLSLVDLGWKLAAFPAYTDQQLDASIVVTPDLSFPP